MTAFLGLLTYTVLIRRKLNRDIKSLPCWKVFGSYENGRIADLAAAGGGRNCFSSSSHWNPPLPSRWCSFAPCLVNK